MAYLIIIVFIAWVLYCVSKAPDTDEGKIAGLFTAVYTFVAWGAIGLGALFFLVGIFVY